MPTLKFSGYIATNNTATAAAGSYTETELTGCDLCPGPTLFRAPLLNNVSLQTFPHKLDPLDRSEILRISLLAAVLALFERLF